VKGVVATQTGELGRDSLLAAHTHLAPIVNQPLVSYVVGSMSSASISEVALVGDAEDRESTWSAVSQRACEPLDLTYLEASTRAESGALLDAQSFVGDAAFAFCSGDTLITGPLGAVAAEFSRTRLDAMVLLSQRGGSPELTDRRLRRVLDAGAAGATAGAFFLRPRIFEAAFAARERTGGRADMADVLQELLAMGGTVGTGSIAGAWRYSGLPRDLLAANRAALDDLDPGPPAIHGDDLDIEGRVVIDPTARVRSSVLRGPLVIGPDAVVTDAYIGPYTCVGRAVDLTCCEIEQSVVLDGSSIANVGTRIHGSVIGPRARVTRTFVRAPAGSHPARRAGHQHPCERLSRSVRRGRWRAPSPPGRAGRRLIHALLDPLAPPRSDKCPDHDGTRNDQPPYES
jgi:glucose-1-phosphate thymidylyltransferase